MGAQLRYHTLILAPSSKKSEPRVRFRARRGCDRTTLGTGLRALALNKFSQTRLSRQPGRRIAVCVCHQRSPPSFGVHLPDAHPPQRGADLIGHARRSADIRAHALRARLARGARLARHALRHPRDRAALAHLWRAAGGGGGHGRPRRLRTRPPTPRREPRLARTPASAAPPRAPHHRCARLGGRLRGGEERRRRTARASRRACGEARGRAQPSSKRERVETSRGAACFFLKRVWPGRRCARRESCAVKRSSSCRCAVYSSAARRGGARSQWARSML